MTYEEKLKSLYKNTVPTIDVEALQGALAEHKEATDRPPLIILDTRAPKEYEVSHLPGAEMIDYERFRPKDVKHIPKNAEIVVYCSVGYRSERIGEKLQDMGYENVKNLYGGIFQWVNDGNAVVNQKAQATDSVHTYNKNWSQWLKAGVKVYE